MSSSRDHDQQEDMSAVSRELFRGAVDDLVTALGRLDDTHLEAVNALAGASGIDKVVAFDLAGAETGFPPSMHAEWSIASAESGKQVLCEKPLARNLRDARAMTEQVRAVFGF